MRRAGTIAMIRWSAALLALAGLMGAAGVGLAAWAAHRSGGDTLMTAALFLLIHASAVAGLSRNAPTTSILAPATILALGASLFSGDLALRLTANLKPWAMAAPTGGVLMIVGWLGLAAVGLAQAADAAKPDKR